MPNHLSSKKEAFLNQLQFELGHRWPELDTDSIGTVSDLKNFIIQKHAHSQWHFLRFLPIYNQIKKYIEKKTDRAITSRFDLNTLKTKDKQDFNEFIKGNFGIALTNRRPKLIRKIIYILPVFLVLVPLLISTYLITAKGVTGWVYLVGLVGLLLVFLAFKATEPLKKQFSPNTLLEYSKSLYVLNNQTISDNPSPKELSDFLCHAAEAYYQQPFNEHSEIP